MRKALPWVYLILPTLIFFAIAFHQLDLPGLYYDESVDAVLTMQLLLGQKMELVRNFGLRIGGVTLPVMVMDYVGAVNTYLLVPFFKVMGIGVIPLRTMTVLAGGATVILTYLLVNRLVNRHVAFIAALLLAVHPSFIFYARQGIHVSSVMSVMALGGLLALVEWYRTSRRWQLWLGAFLFGLGLSAKILFLWFIAAVIGVFLVWKGFVLVRDFALGGMSVGMLRKHNPNVIGQAGLVSDSPLTPSTGSGRRLALPSRVLRTSSQRERGFQVAGSLITVIGAITAFTAGAWMLLYYNYKTQGTIEVMTKSARISQSGVDNTDIVTNFGTRLETLRVLLNGEHFWFLGGLFSFSLYPWIFVLSLFAVAIATLILPPLASYRGAAWLFLGILTLVLAQSIFTVSGIWPTHLFILLPFVAIIISLAIYTLYITLPRPASYLAASAITLLLVLGCLSVDYRYHASLSETGGRRAQSDAIYRLTEYLDAKGTHEPVAMDWGIKSSVQIVSQGRVNPVEIFGYTPEPGGAFLELLNSMLQSPEKVYIFKIPEMTVFQRQQAFTDMIEKQQKKADLEYTARERDGTPIYLVYRVS